MRDITDPPVPVYLVWSNKQGAWWGPGGHGYVHDVWKAGRFDEAAATEACGRRTWERLKPPPEVMVTAPENDQATFTPDELRYMPELMSDRVAAATQAAMDLRRELAAAKQGGEVTR